MLIKLTLSSEGADLVKKMYAEGELAHIGVVGLLDLTEHRRQRREKFLETATPIDIEEAVLHMLNQIIRRKADQQWGNTVNSLSLPEQEEDKHGDP